MIRNINSPNSVSEEEQRNYEDSIMKEAISQISYSNLIKDQNGYIKKIINSNEKSVELIQKQNTKSGLSKLQNVEKMLEFAANCGVNLDRNLIIVALYNQACAYQRLWVLDKAQHYLDGAIYNTELIVQEEEAEYKISKGNDIHKSLSILIQRQSFLTKSYLQLCAILSQLGEHKQALETAKKSLKLLSKLFKLCNDYCLEDVQSSSPQLAGVQQNSQNLSAINTTANSSEQQRNSGNEYSQEQTNVFLKKNEVQFQKVVIDLARPILQDMVESSLEDLERDEILQLHKAKEQIYFWRSNPENNERLIRMELQTPPVTGSDSNSTRSLLGVQGGLNWAENFNIGTIMHIQPLLYDDFCVFGEMILELQKKLLLEKVIYMSISYFTMATEMRFIHLEKIEQLRFQPIEQDKLSEIYHLKAIEIACKHITCSTPFINHLITSYQKHYKQNLDTIVQIKFKYLYKPEESISHKSQSEFNIQVICKENEFLPIQFSPKASTLKIQPPQKIFNQHLQITSNAKKERPKNDQNLSKNQLILQQIMQKGVKIQQGQLNIAQLIKQKGQQQQNQSIIEQNKSNYSKSQYISAQNITPRGSDSSRGLLPYSLNESRGSISKRSFDIDQKLAQMTAKTFMIDNQRCFPNKIQPRAQDINFICELSNKKSKQAKIQSSPKASDQNKTEKQLQIGFSGTKKLSNLLHLNISEINLLKSPSVRPQSSDQQNKITFSLSQMQKLKPRIKESRQQTVNFSNTDRSHYDKKQVKDQIIEKAKYSQLIQQFDTYLRNLRQK